MQPVYLQVNPQWLFALERLHEVAHDLPKDFEDTLTVNLTRQDYALLLLGADVLYQFHPCLERELVNLSERLKELREAQKPDWTPVEVGEEEA